MVRTITQPAEHSSLASAVVRQQLQLLENEICAVGKNYVVTGNIDGANQDFTIPIEVNTDFTLYLADQPQAPTIAGAAWTAAYTYTVNTGMGTTTIHYLVAPDASLSGYPHWVYITS